MTSLAILIPARYDSTRFPGKPLADLGGTPMVERVYNTCVESGLDTYVLTDDERIGTLFNSDNVIYSDQEFHNGTERCAYASGMLPYDAFINVQGDMPDVTVDMINRVGQLAPTGLITAWTEMPELLQSDPNCVKIVHNNIIAHWCGRGLTTGDRHIGIYGYPKDLLAQYGHKPDRYETHERLEQLRWLADGHRLRVRRVDFNGIEINTPEDARVWNESSR